jgi:outer membrane protein OmpA-like peptidoglycan-associated protein
MAGFAANLGNSAQSLTTLAEQRATAVRDYLAARDVNPDRLSLAEPIVETSDDAQPQVTFTLNKK